MSSNQQPDWGDGLASLMISQVILSTLLKRGLLSPQELRDLLDGIALRLEEMAGFPGQKHRSHGARQQIELITEALERAHPEMRARFSDP